MHNKKKVITSKGSIVKLCIRVNEAADYGIVISALQIIEPGLGVVDIAAVAQGVNGSQGDVGGIRGDRGLAVGVVGVGGYYLLAAVHDVKHIALFCTGAAKQRISNCLLAFYALSSGMVTTAKCVGSVSIVTPWLHSFPPS